MNGLDKSLITEFLMIDRKIGRMRDTLTKIERVFYNSHSFMSSPMNIDETGARLGGRPWPTLVENLVSAEQNMRRNIKMMEYQRRYFQRYYSGLTTQEQGKLWAGQESPNPEESQLERDTLAEIGQILEACAWRYGLEQDIHVEPVRNGGQMEVENMIDLLELMG